jgi:sterol desaturase/sphingolipid hydroxylase (fatty acid hydroxylase superfamily)
MFGVIAIGSPANSTIEKAMASVALFISVNVIYEIFDDATLRGQSKAYAILGAFLGGVGGLIYWFAVGKHNDIIQPKTPEEKETHQEEKTNSRQDAKRNFAYFNFAITIMLALAFLFTMPWQQGVAINWTTSGIVGGLTLVFFILFLITKPAKTKATTA